MDENGATDDTDSIDWDTEDELEIEDASRMPDQYVFRGSNEASSSTSSSNSKVITHFMAMGFSKRMVVQAIKENGEHDEQAILDTILMYSALEDSPQEPPCASTAPRSFEPRSNARDDLSDVDSYLGNWENTDHVIQKDQMLSHLLDMGYLAEEALTAIDRCGLDTSLAELTDFLSAAHMAKEADARAHFRESSHEDESIPYPHSKHEFIPYPHSKCNDYILKDKKRKFDCVESWKSRKLKSEKKVMVEDDDIPRLPNPMTGFGVPGDPWSTVHRTLPKTAMAPPYFYYENVALTPKGVWMKISRFLYEVEPEFVDSVYFSAAARKRGYIHNLPIDNRYPLMPIPPLTIQKALPLSKKWWPSWDTRTKLNCVQGCIGSAKLTERIRKILEECGGEPSSRTQKQIINECKRWNLVWVGKNKVAPLEPDEMEMLLGFPGDHTRGGGISRTERYKALGNTFQVDTVAYHLSVLKDLFPLGINVLSLFSGIGGAEVALHRLGIPLKNVVSVEISETGRNIIRSWWEQTNQRGNLIHVEDVHDVTSHKLEEWFSAFGRFDLVIGGSPCNNLSGSNRVSRDGLEGKHSSLFFEYFRILDLVKSMTGSYL